MLNSISGMIIEPKRYEIQDVFNLIGEDRLMMQNDRQQSGSDIVVDGFKVHPISLRYETFYQKGIKCACCGIEGTHFKLCGNKDTNRRHFNLFADDGTLMTKDHIIPKSKGGQDMVDNMQTMCEKCNIEKGAFHPDIKIEYIIATSTSTGSRCKYKSVETAAKDITSKRRPPKKDAINCAINTTVQIITAIREQTECFGYVWTTEMM